MRQSLLISSLALMFSLLFTPVHAEAKIVEYDLTIASQEVNITGKPSRGMTINGNIPGPVLYFTEGDTARIHVHNRMAVDTSIHWHGVLVPPGMDGVPYISFPPIRPGTTFTYEFPIRQSGTYWYHSHTDLQEQSGVYGGIVIEPRQEKLQTDGDHVILVSDWTDEDPHTVLRTLKRGSEWYALEKGSAQSIVGAARLGMLGSYWRRELQRMPPMDIADVAYDRFLANGRSSVSLPARHGEKIRLRVINGSATTYFHLEFAGSLLTIVSADGQDVHPVQKERILIGVAETYDLIVTVPGAGAYEFRATAHDGSGFASTWIGSGKHHPAQDIPRPNLYHTMGHAGLEQIFALTPAGSMGMADSEVQAGRFDRPGMAGMESMRTMEAMAYDSGHDAMNMQGMEHEAGPENEKMQMEMKSSPVHETMSRGREAALPPEDPQGGKKYGTDFRFLAADVSSSAELAHDGMDSRRPGTPYRDLKAVRSTGFADGRAVREIRLTLDGDMERYVWFLNNKPLSESDYIRIREGEVVRFIMINRTMMHHPMHLHGHFFRVVNGQGDHAPLKHTVDVAPMSTTVIEFDANEKGDWFFHCHLLYHMKSGMARMVHYDDFTVGPELAAVRPNLYKESWYFLGQADILSNMTEGFLSLSDTRNIFSFDWEGGWEEVEHTEWEGVFAWNRYVNRFFTFFAGIDLEIEDDELDETRGVFGLHYVLPLNLESRVWLDTEGDARINLERTLELTPRISLHGEVEYDTREKWEGKVGLSYLILKSVSLVGQWHSEFGVGVGAQVRF
ncbi:MAG: multicopper oxidase domain-containing protein [Desulfobulbaceae bacterium]|nr:multicopper oxidase domain-containing protein [Desulfobulbaceae bacterium]